MLHGVADRAKRVVKALLVPHRERVPDVLEPGGDNAPVGLARVRVVEVVGVGHPVDVHRHQEVVNPPTVGVAVIKRDGAVKDGAVLLDGTGDAVLVVAPQEHPARGVLLASTAAPPVVELLGRGVEKAERCVARLDVSVVAAPLEP